MDEDEEEATENVSETGSEHSEDNKNTEEKWNLPCPNCENYNKPVSYSQLPLITMTIDSFLQYEPRLDVKYS